MDEILESQIRSPIAYAEALQGLLEANDRIRARWEADASALTGALSSLSPDAQITCEKGCGACCFFPLVPASAGEAFLAINRQLAAGVPMPELKARCDAYATRYLDAARAAGGFPFTEAQRAALFALRLPCPLLARAAETDLGGACAAYPDRPFICDYYHSLDNPFRCALKAPHRSFQPLHERGELALDEQREAERALFGRSALGHLPLLMAALLEPRGIALFLMRVEVEPGVNASRAEAEALLDFQFYAELLGVLGYEVTDADIASIARAQDELGR